MEPKLYSILQKYIELDIPTMKQMSGKIDVIEYKIEINQINKYHYILNPYYKSRTGNFKLQIHQGWSKLDTIKEPFDDKLWFEMLVLNKYKELAQQQLDHIKALEDYPELDALLQKYDNYCGFVIKD